MKLKKVAKRVAPPIVLDAARWLRRPFAGAPEWEYVPEGWARRDPKIKGWNEGSILETQKAKWPSFVASLHGSGPLGIAHEATTPSANDYAAHNTLMAYAYVLALAARKKDRISILDWGGGLGHYYLISRALLPGIEIDYYCKDVPLLCQGGRELLPEVTFYETEQECFGRTYDLVLASTSLHYSEDWKRVAELLAAASHSYLYVARLPVVWHARSFVVVQRPYQYGYATEYLGWYLNQQEFLGHLKALSMELVREFLMQDKAFIVGAPEQGEYKGFLFLRPAPSQ